VPIPQIRYEDDDGEDHPMRRARRLFTPANAIACLALFVALGGTGWAGQVIGRNSVGRAQLKTNAVTTSKLADRAVTADKLAPGVVGGVSAGKIVKVDAPIAAVQPNSTGTPVTATCPAGGKAVSGGYNAGLYAYVISEAPTADGSGWTVTFGTELSPASVSASAMCLMR
jgi:hypothetical protein